MIPVRFLYAPRRPARYVLVFMISTGSGGENLRGDVVVFHLAAGLGEEEVTLPTCGGNGRRIDRGAQ